MIKIIYAPTGPIGIIELSKVISKEESRGKMLGTYENNVHIVSEHTALSWDDLKETLASITQYESSRNQDQYIVTNSILALVGLIQHIQKMNKKLKVYTRKESVLWSKENEDDIEFYIGGGLKFMGSEIEVISNIISLEFFSSSLPFDLEDPKNDPIERFISIYKEVKE